MQNASQKVKDYKEKCKTLTHYFIYLFYIYKESVFMHFSLLNIDVDTKYHPPHIQSMRVLVQNERFTSFITQSVMSFLISKGNLFFSKHIHFLILKKHNKRGSVAVSPTQGFPATGGHRPYRGSQYGISTADHPIQRETSLKLS